MKRPNFFIIFLVLCASFAWGDELPDSVGTSAEVAGMATDSISANGTVPTMGWDTTTMTRIVVIGEILKPTARRFSLQGFRQDAPNRFTIENNLKIIIKQ